MIIVISIVLYAVRCCVGVLINGVLFVHNEISALIDLYFVVVSRAVRLHSWLNSGNLFLIVEI